MGSGLVVVRGDWGDWSPPSALAMASVGWGLQAGGALHDLLIVLRNRWVLLLIKLSLRAWCQGCFDALLINLMHTLLKSQHLSWPWW